MYDFIATKPLSTGEYDHPIKKSTSSNDDIEMDVNPAYGERTIFTNNSTKAKEDAEYEVVDSQSRRTKTDDIKMDVNPAYAETKFT